MKTFYLPAALLAMCALNSAPSYAAQFPADIQSENIFHAFNWTFNEIRNHLQEIADAGYGAIQVSPVQGNAAANADWFYAYLPYDFAFTGNGNGTKGQLRNLCAEAKEKGLAVIVDVVANHMNPKSGFRAAWWNESGRLRNSSAVNYNNRYSITHGNLGNYQDVNSEDPEVQARCKEFIQQLKEIGVSGIRWDAAKHIGLPSEDCAFWAKMAEVEGLWHYGEILDNPGTNSDSQWNVMKEYMQYMSVTDNMLPSSMLSNVGAGKMPSKVTNLAAPKTDGGQELDAKKLIYWGESHDTYSNEGGQTKYVSQSAIDNIYMILGCRKDEAALYFSRPEKKGYTEIKMGKTGSLNGLQSKGIVAVNTYRKLMKGFDEVNASRFGSDGWFINVRRDHGAFIVIPVGTAGKDVSIPNPEGALPAGEYTDEIGGGKFTVTATTISGHVGGENAAVLYRGGIGAIDDIEFENHDVTPVYYDLTGRRVSSPDKGIFIKVEGSKRTKIIL